MKMIKKNNIRSGYSLKKEELKKATKRLAAVCSYNQFFIYCTLTKTIHRGQPRALYQRNLIFKR